MAQGQGESMTLSPDEKLAIEAAVGGLNFFGFVLGIYLGYKAAARSHAQITICGGSGGSDSSTMFFCFASENPLVGCAIAIIISPVLSASLGMCLGAGLYNMCHPRRPSTPLADSDTTGGATATAVMDVANGPAAQQGTSMSSEKDSLVSAHV